MVSWIRSPGVWRPRDFRCPPGRSHHRRSCRGKSCNTRYRRRRYQELSIPDAIRFIARAGETWGFRQRRLDRVERGEECLAAGLASEAHVRGERINIRIAYAITHATVAISEGGTALVVDRNFVEVQKIAIDCAAALLPNAALTLDGVIRTDVGGNPCLAAIKCRGHESIPIAGEA